MFPASFIKMKLSGEATAMILSEFYDVLQNIAEEKHI